MAKSEDIEQGSKVHRILPSDPNIGPGLNVSSYSKSNQIFEMSVSY